VLSGLLGRNVGSRKMGGEEWGGVGLEVGGGGVARSLSYNGIFGVMLRGGMYIQWTINEF
jgi:hypothetical protein